MGVIKQGILGGFRKKTGTVVGANWRSLDVIRALPRNSGKTPTQLQMNQQQKFKLVTGFLSNFSSLINIGFKTTGSIQTAINLAVAYHLKEAVTGSEPAFEIDLAKVRFSKGKLESPLEFAAGTTQGAIAVLTWTNDEANDRYIDGTDQLNMLAYNPQKQKFIKVIAVAERKDRTYLLQLPANFTGDIVHIYAGFSSAKIKMLNSDSAYLGTVTLL